MLAETGAFGSLPGRTQPGKVLIILAGKDTTVKFNEVAPALRQVFAQSIDSEGGQAGQVQSAGKKKEALVRWKVYGDDGHDIVATKGIDIADDILDFWGLKESGESIAPLRVHA